ncbi:MAG TPA: Ig-like domain-containing protein, partial [Tissierellaceae bacterium]
MIKQKNLSLFLALIMIIQVLIPINQVFAENSMDNFDSPQTNIDGENQKPEASTLLPEVNLKEEAEKPHIDLLLPQITIPQEEQEKPHLGLPMAPWEDEVKKVIDEYEKINKENLVTRENKLENIFSKPKVSINDILLNPNTNEVTEVKNKDIIKAEYNWSTDQDINAGDYTLIPIPNNITMPKSIIRLLDIEGKEVGFASFENGFIRVQFNERLEGKVNKNGTLTFITEIDEKDFEENINKTINFDGDKYNLSLKRESDSKLEKSARLGEDKKSINWEIDAVVSKNDIDKNIKLEDEMGTKFLDGKIEVFELIVGSGSVTEGSKLGEVEKFPIEINKLNKNSKNAFRFKFKTRIDNEFQDKYENTATLSLDGQKIQATANIENIISNEIKKTGQLIKKPGETVKVEWKIVVNDKNRSYDKLIVKDLINKQDHKYKQEYIKDSLKVIDPTVSKTEDIGKDKYNLTITDKDITIDLGKTDKSYEILYTTEVKYNNNFIPGTSVEIKNKAELFNNDKSIDNVDSIVYDSRQKLINIWGSSTQDIPDSEGGGKKISWTELINDGKECLEKPSIITTLEPGHDFIKDSLQIVTHQGVELVKGKDYDVVIEG